MRLIETPEARHRQIADLIEKCEVSRSEREDKNRKLRRFILYGTDDGRFSRYNKLYHSLRLKAAFLYSSRTVRFAIEPPPGVAPEMHEQAEEAGSHLTRVWRQSEASRLYAQAVFWSLGYGNMLTKFGWNGGLRAWLMEPSQFGVLREENPQLANQEAVSLRFFSSRSEVRRVLELSGRDEETIKRLMRKLPSVEGGDGTPDNFIGRLVISAVSPNIVGAVQGMGNITTTSEPKTSEELVEMRELRVYDDAAKDYRVFTVALPDVVLFDRPAADLDIKGILPYSGVTPNPLYDYFWGTSEGEMLMPLQSWREKRMDQLDKLFTRQLNPPGFAKGVTGLTDEKYAAAFRRGGVISSNVPNAELTPMYPQLPPESFAEINAIDSMFNVTLGLPPILQGENPTGGAKGESGLSVMVQMASAPIVAQSLEVEASLERAGDICWRLLRRNDATVLTTDRGEKFTCGLLPDGCTVRVAAHSSSPLFASELKQEALQMLEAGLIDGQTYLELTDPPMESLLSERLKRREEDEKKEHDQMMQAVMQTVEKAPADEKPGLLMQLFELLTGRTSKAPSRPNKRR